MERRCCSLVLTLLIIVIFSTLQTESSTFGANMGIFRSKLMASYAMGFFLTSTLSDLPFGSKLCSMHFHVLRLARNYKKVVYGIYQCPKRSVMNYFSRKQRTSEVFLHDNTCSWLISPIAMHIVASLRRIISCSYTFSWMRHFPFFTFSSRLSAYIDNTFAFFHLRIKSVLTKMVTHGPPRYSKLFTDYFTRLHKFYILTMQKFFSYPSYFSHKNIITQKMLTRHGMNSSWRGVSIA